jgi:hypothetical protein
MIHRLFAPISLVLVSATLATTPSTPTTHLTRSTHGAGATAAPDSPYAGMESRAIKTLSPDDVSGYLAGRGMGFAMAAELNSYPGPKHVLELRDALGLNEEQVRQAEQIFDEMHGNAVRLGERYVAKEQQLDALFSDGLAVEEELDTLVAEVAGIRGELRYAHLTAHLAMRRVMSEAQVSRYDELRGYRALSDAPGEGPGAPTADCPHR